jgi:ParB family transcriptional regulator, chromosome partitioning protein
MPARSGLGKGLDALIPGGSGAVSGSGAAQVAIDSVAHNPRQPRQSFKESELLELAASIREHGIIQPLIVAPAMGGTYTLIAGERRLQAARRAGLTKVPVVIRSASDQQLLELALIENVQRADLNPIEEAQAFQHLAKEFGLSHDAIATRVAKSRVAVTNTLRLLDASAAVKQALVDSKISEGHARALLALSSAKAQEIALQRVLNLDLSVRQTELLARKLSGQRPVPKKKPRRSADVADVEKRLRASLGTKVALKAGKKGGTLTIHYYSDEELEALLERLL